MADLPSNISYGQVGGRFLLAVADTTDPGRAPDSLPAQGKVKFTPSVGHVINATALPDPVFITPNVIECTLDAEGYLVDSQGERDVWLIAGDDPDLNPTGWTYKVTFELTGVTIPSFNLLVETDVRKDLALTTPIPTNPGTTVVVSEESRVAAEAAALRAEEAADRAENAGGGSGTITEVNGQTGPVVTLGAGDVGALPNQYPTPDGNQRLPYYLANTGQFGYVIMDVNASNGSVVKRQASGHVLVPSEPTFGTHATSKTYVDAQITAIELTPGPKGDKGDQGDPGVPGVNSWEAIPDKPAVIAAGADIAAARAALKIFVLGPTDPTGTDPEAIYIRRP